MKGVDQSQMSRSATESADAKAASDVRKSKLDLVFPLFDQMNSVVRIPGLIYKIGALYFYLQSLSVSVWPQSRFYTNSSATEYNVLRYFMLVFWFTDITDYTGSIVPSFAVVVCATALTFIILFFQLHYYRTRRSFMKWSLYISKIVFDFLAPILAVPSGALIATSFLLVVRMGNGVYWAYLIISIICYIAVLFVAIFSLKLNSKSAIISKCPYPLFDDLSLTLYFISTTIFLILAAVLTTYPSWALEIIIALHFGFEIVIFIQSLSLPFHHLIDNAIFTGIVADGMIMDLFMFIFYFTPNLPTYIIYIVEVAGLVGFITAAYFFLAGQMRLIKKNLTNEGNMEDSAKSAHFLDLGLDQNELKAMTYLRVGFTQAADLFIDNSLVNFLIKNLRKNKSFAQLLQLVTFFPSEQRSVNVLFKVLYMRRDLTVAERFLIYQVQRIKTLRASHSSIAATELLLELHQANEQCQANINSFWTMPSASITFCETRHTELEKTNLLWLEAIDTYPNNPKMSYEYSRFLTECVTDFELSIFHHQKGELIEGGRSFAVDNSFRAFVREFPNYLKKGIVNVKGKKINKVLQAEQQQQNNNATISRTSSSSSSGSAGSNTFGSTNNFTVDAEMEDLVGKKILKNSRMRMTLFHALEGRKSHIKKWVWLAEFLIFFAIIAVFLVYYIIMIDDYSNRANAVINIARMKNLRFNQNVIMYLILTRFGVENNKLILQNVVDFNEYGQEFEEYISFYDKFESQVLSYLSTLKTNLLEMFNNVAELGSQGNDVYTISGWFLNQGPDAVYCYNSAKVKTRSVSYIDKLSYVLYLDADMTTLDSFQKLYEENNMCELVLNLQTATKDASNINQAFIAFARKNADNLDNLLTMLRNFIIYLLIILTFVPMLIANIGFMLEIRKVLKMMLALPDDVKKASMEQIGSKQEEANNLTPKPVAPVSYSLLYLFLYLVVTAISAGLSYYFITKMVDVNNNIINYASWYDFAVKRFTGSADVGFSSLQFIALSDPAIKPKFLEKENILAYIPTFVNSMNQANQDLLQGTDTVPACYGVDDEIDALHLSPRCTLTESTNDLHDTYRCSSAVQQFAVLGDLITQIRMDTTGFNNGNFSDPITLNLIHLLSNHLWDTLNQVCLRLSTLISQSYTDLKNESLILLIVSVVISICTLAITIYYQAYIDSTYTFMISLIKHIPPLQLMASKSIMDFLLNRKSSDDSKSMNISQAIIHNSSDAILCTNLNGIIEIINPTVTNILGYTPDQLLGQQITTFFAPDSADEVGKQIGLMANGQSGSVFEKSFKCISDSGTEVNFHVTIIGMKADGSNDISSFVFILTDETELLKQQREAEEAKAKSEKLLYQILPKDVVRRLNSGEKDITYQIPHATIIFIDIVKFSEYSSNLTPQEIMRNLSTVFAKFDETIAKYTSMIKIKLIGDVYMAAAGLFGKPEDAPNYHAEETVKFALECITAMDEINVKLNSSLEVRVGVNTGGPLLAGILGTDKPVFDIIGDPINIASRLQSTDIPMHVQISKATMELLDQTQFSIEERGEVFLKGKGKQMTYLVTPGMTFMHMGSSFTIASTTVTNNTSQNNLPAQPNANPPANPA